MGWMDIIIDLITKYKCDTNCKDDYGRTPLHCAAHNNHLEVVRYFINEQHYDPLNKDRFGNTLLHIACKNGDMNTVQVLISETHQNLSCENSDGNTPLHIACHNDHLHIVKYLLSTGNVNPFARNNKGRIPLYTFNTRTSYKLPMLHLAAHHGWMDIIIDLITKYKCDTNCKDDYGRTPTTLCCM